LKPGLVVFDFDGVLTDNRVLVLDNGQEAVFCNRSDGMAIGALCRA
jgi:3-deoxy-D-manno-octulosonate 8-phosphate phosphatase (KDO 8-P phosphatase)